MKAVRSQHREMTIALVQRGVDVNATSDLGWSPLALACSAGHIEIARVLIASGADVNLTTPAAETPLIWSSHRGDLDSVAALLGAGGDPNLGLSGITPLMWAVMNGHDAVAHRIVGAGADVRVANDAGLDAAGLADRFDRPELGRWLRQVAETFAP